MKPIEPWRRAPTYAGGPSILSTRTLATGHRRLAELLRPAQAVLDVGCGPGAITRGIAEAVGPGGRVVGTDLNARMIEEGVLTEAERAAAEADHRDWVATRAQSQTLYLVAVEGVRSA